MGSLNPERPIDTPAFNPLATVDKSLIVHLSPFIIFLRDIVAASPTPHNANAFKSVLPDFLIRFAVLLALAALPNIGNAVAASIPRFKRRLPASDH